MKRTVVLVILDGWGLGEPNDSNPIYVTAPKTFAELEENFPVTSLQASGISVGLPWGEVGNSEVGHLTLGSGKTIYQYFPKIVMAIRDGTFFQNEALLKAVAHAKKNNAAVNLVGLLTAGTVHAALDHLLALIQLIENAGVTSINLHLFGDGKDSPPKTLPELLKKIPAKYLATLIGRYYAMDRNQNWALTQKTYECLLGTSGETPQNLDATLKETYRKGLSEEYLPPLRLDPQKSIRDGDAVIFFNFREDSIRQLSEAFILPDFNKFPVTQFKNLKVVTLTRYEDRFNVPVAFPPDDVTWPLSRVLSENDKTQLKVAETYKYAHVTYFFNGYREPPFKNEYRVLIPSLTIPHPDEQPELRASVITDRILETIQSQSFDFVLANYSNPDTIAHTGNYEACLKAIKVIDEEVGRLVKTALETTTALVITSDHGNAEQVINPQTGKIETQHDPNPVPLYLVASEFKGRRFPNWRSLREETLGILSDVAPTVLELMGVERPADMTGKSLLQDLI